MRSKLLPFFLLTACSPDLIQHGQPDASLNTGSDATASDANDAGPAPDADPQDAEAQDAVTLACNLSGTRNVDVIARLGQTINFTVQVQNDGTTPCTFTRVLIDPTGEFVLVAAPLSPVLQPGQTITLDGTYQPTDLGEDRAVLRFETNAGSGVAFEIALLGTTGPEDIASTQTVTFNVANTSTVPVYLFTNGWFCDAYDPGVATSLGFQCICECPSPGQPRAQALIAIQPGGSHAFTWDARRLVTFSHAIDCSMRGFPGSPTTSEVLASKQPAPAGTYTFRAAFERSVPSHCFPTQNDEYQCSMQNMGGFPLPPVIAEICPATYVSATYTLPAQGDVTVQVAIP